MNTLLPLAAVYGAAVAARGALYDRGLLAVRRLKWPVVSVGNIVAGGAGKTPFVIHLGELLQQKQVPFDILTRGYGRQSSSLCVVDSASTSLDCGDEPVLLAEKLNVPVVVYADRFAAGRHAEKIFADMKPAHGGSWLHLLDDGFQHRRLARDFDIVLITPTDARDHLLPAGRLREPVSALRRADAVVLLDGACSEELPLAGKHVWRATRRVEIKHDELPDRPVAVCALANNKRFLADLGSAGVASVAEMTFRDHHEYSAADVTALLRMRDQHSSCGFVTTEKDAVKLRRFAELAPLYAVPLRLELVDPKRAVETILGTLAERLLCPAVD